jgi:hypothetical protein
MEMPLFLVSSNATVIGPLAGHTALNPLATGADEAAGGVSGAGSKGRLATGPVVTAGEAGLTLAALGGATRNTCPTSMLLGSLMAFHN